MSKRQARKLIASGKQGMTVKEFLKLCHDMGFWFDTVLDNEELLTAYNVLTGSDITIF